MSAASYVSVFVKAVFTTDIITHRNNLFHMVQDNWTVLHFAARKGHLSVVRVLLNHVQMAYGKLDGSRSLLINAVNKV